MTVEEAKAIIEEAKAAGLSGRGFLVGLGVEKVATACNGCGPASWPEKFRKKLDRWLSIFRAAFGVHDCRFSYLNDGTRELFDFANAELECNCIVLADRKYGWYNPLRYFARHAGHLIYHACDMFGWSAWVDAKKGSSVSSSEFRVPSSESREPTTQPPNHPTT